MFLDFKKLRINLFVALLIGITLYTFSIENFTLAIKLAIIMFFLIPLIDITRSAKN